MAERNRKPSEDSKQDMDKLFLDKSGVKEMMSDLVSKLTANRPGDPLQFMSDYFQSTFEQTNRLEKCYRTIMLTHHSRPVFRQNVATAFSILNQTKVGKNLNGVNGLIFDELLNMLLQGSPEGHIEKIKGKLRRRNHEVVTYESFCYAVTVLVIYIDYLGMAGQLFELLDVKDAGQVDKVYSEILLNQLKSTFTSLTQGQDNGIEAGITLSPHALHTVLAKIPHTAAGKQYLNNSEFLELAADAYLPLILSEKS